MEPVRPLRADTEYRLALRQSRSPFVPRLVKWTTTAVVDHETPGWEGGLRLDQRGSTVPGPTWAAVAGSGVHLSLDLDLADADQPFAALVGVTPPEPAVRFTTFSWVEKSSRGLRVQLPAGPCETLAMRSGQRYTVSVAVIDAAGNRSEQRSIGLRVPPPPLPLSYQVVTTTTSWEGSVRAKVEPTSPEASRRARIAGIVSGQLQVNDSGDVVEVIIEKGLPMGLTEATVSALSQWKFNRTPGDSGVVPFSTHFLLVTPAYEADWQVEARD